MKKSKLLYILIFTFITTSIFSQSTWNTLKTGAGGWATGMDIHPSGSPIYARVDVGSAYRWDSSNETWTNIVTAENLPSNEVYWNQHAGVLSIVSAPSDNNIAYLAYFDGIYKSPNQGDNWTKTNFPEMDMPPNDDDSKLSGERLSVDPANADVVYFGSVDDGLWFTQNGGTNWSKINAVPDGANSRGIRQILFDDNSGITGGKTNRIYAFVDEEGVYKSEDAGSSWNLISFGVSSPWFYDAEIAVDGNIYIAGESSNYVPFGVYQYDGNNWTQIFSDDLSIAMGEIAVDPFNADRLFIFSYGYTDTYRTLNINASNPNWTYLGFDKTSNGIPWLSWTYSNWFSIGEVVMDPIVEDRMWQADGVGLWRTEDTKDSQITWEEKSVDQEHLVSNDIIALPNRKAVTVHWDRPVFYHDDLNQYPSIHQPSSRFNSAWDIDQSPQDQNFLVAIIEDHRYCCYDEDTRSSGWSEDGGQSWTKFLTMPNPGFENSQYGMIAVSANDNDNIVWLPVGNEMPYFTNDRGDTWTQVNLPDASDQCCLAANYFKRRALTADRVLDNTFYIYDFGNGSIFKTTNGGSSWIKYTDVLPPYAYNVKLTSVPGKADHLFFAKGAEEATSLIGPLRKSTDGGQTWNALANTDEVLNVTLGKEEEGADYPTIFIYGRVDGILGYWMSTDEGDTWTQIGDYPNGIYDWPAVMEGDMNIHGQLYIGFGGNGFVYHELDGALPVTLVEPLWGFEKEGKNILKWITSDEIYASHFEIQRSTNNEFWDGIGRVNTKANSSDTSWYNFVDHQLKRGANYYRLKMVDQDGKYQYSNIIIIESVLLSDFEIAPNPAQDQIIIATEIRNGKLDILNINGQILQSLSISNLNTNLDVSDLPKGIYFVRLSTESGNTFSKKMIKN